MALNSINTNIAAYFAQANIGKASTMASSSIARLSSGDRIVRASDDVAAMSAGTSLRTNVTTLKMALINTSQGASLLQVADGALSQVTDILQRQKAIAVQAGSGSLSDAERGFLNQEFQNLAEEIDRLAGQTNFNGVNLLDGSLSEKVDVTDNDTSAVQGFGSIAFGMNAAVNETININGTIFTAVAAPATNVQFRLGGTVEETLDSLVTVLNASPVQAVGLATYSRSGNSLVMTADGGGTQSNNFRIRADLANSTWVTRAATVTAAPNLFGNTARSLVFTAGTPITATNIDTAIVSAAGGLAATPFKTAEVLKVDIDGAGALGTVNVSAAFLVTDTLRTIVTSINSNTVTTGVAARIVGSAGAYNIELEYSRQSVDGQYDAAAGSNADLVASTTTPPGLTYTAAGGTTAARIWSLDGGTDTGLGAGDTVGVGTVGNNILTAQNQTKSFVEVIFPDVATTNLTSSLIATGGVNAFGITVGGVTFRATSNTAATSSATEATLGANLQETLDNFVAKINSYQGTEDQMYQLNQVRARRDGNTIVFDSKDVGATGSLTAANTAVTVVTSGTFAASTSTTNLGLVSNGSATGGINTSNVRNADFLGKIEGFTATYNGTNNQVDMQVVIGDHTYKAVSVTSNPAVATIVRFSSETGGGSFDVQMAANNGQAVSNQSQANIVGQRFNAAFESMSFYQNRTISSYNGDSPIVTAGVVTGSLIGTNMEMQLSSFESVAVDQIRITAPQGSSENGAIVMVVNGTEYRAASDIGSKLGANQIYKLQSATNADEFISFTTGSEVIDFSTDAKAATFQEALEVAFGVGDGSAELAFQVGVTTADTLSVGINNVTTNKIYGGQAIDVLTKDNAAIASDVIDDAIDMVTSVRAEVGALQSRFDFASANIESSIQNQDAARGVLLDTDVASESTAYATAQVQLQAGIAVLAQANLLPQNLLKLIG